jgi:RimJ/RimL family protein N-acetyltransferase
MPRVNVAFLLFMYTGLTILQGLFPGYKMVEGMFELDSDPVVHRYLGNQPVQDIEQSREAIRFIRQQYLDNGIGRWAVIEKSTGYFLGWAGLKLVKEPANNHTGFYDVGYRLIKKYWGKGFATEAAKAVVDYGFEVLQLPVIYGMADINNAASAHVLQKTGLQLIEAFDLNGTPHHWFKISREEWKKGQ